MHVGPSGLERSSFPHASSLNPILTLRTGNNRIILKSYLCLVRLSRLRGWGKEHCCGGDYR